MKYFNCEKKGALFAPPKSCLLLMGFIPFALY